MATSTFPSLGPASGMGAANVGFTGMGNPAVNNLSQMMPQSFVAPRQGIDGSMEIGPGAAENLAMIFGSDVLTRGARDPNMGAKTPYRVYRHWFDGQPLNTGVNLVFEELRANQWWIFKLFPVEQGARMERVTQIMFDDTIWDEAAELGPHRILGFNMHEWTQTTTRRNLGFRMELSQLFSPEGPAYYAAQMRALANGAALTMYLNGMKVLLSSSGRPPQNQYEILGVAQPQSFALEAVRHEVLLWGGLHLRANGARNVASFGKDALIESGTGPANMLIVGQGIWGRLSNAPENSYYLATGVPGSQQKPVGVPSVAGVQVVETQKLKGGDGVMRDPVSTVRAIGEFYIFDSSNQARNRPEAYQSGAHSIDVFNFDTRVDDWETIDFETALRASGLFDSSGLLSDEVGQPFFSSFGSFYDYLRRTRALNTFVRSVKAKLGGPDTTEEDIAASFNRVIRKTLEESEERQEDEEDNVVPSTENREDQPMYWNTVSGRLPYNPASSSYPPVRRPLDDSNVPERFKDATMESIEERLRSLWGEDLSGAPATLDAEAVADLRARRRRDKNNKPTFAGDASDSDTEMLEMETRDNRDGVEWFRTPEGKARGDHLLRHVTATLPNLARASAAVHQNIAVGAVVVSGNGDEAERRVAKIMPILKVMDMILAVFPNTVTARNVARAAQAISGGDGVLTLGRIAEDDRLYSAIVRSGMVNFSTLGSPVLADYTAATMRPAMTASVSNILAEAIELIAQHLYSARYHQHQEDDNELAFQSIEDVLKKIRPSQITRPFVLALYNANIDVGCAFPLLLLRPSMEWRTQSAIIANSNGYGKTSVHGITFTSAVGNGVQDFSVHGSMNTGAFCKVPGASRQLPNVVLERPLNGNGCEFWDPLAPSDVEDFADGNPHTGKSMFCVPLYPNEPSQLRRLNNGMLSTTGFFNFVRGEDKPHFAMAPNFSGNWGIQQQTEWFVAFGHDQQTWADNTRCMRGQSRRPTVDGRGGVTTAAVCDKGAGHFSKAQLYTGFVNDVVSMDYGIFPRGRQGMPAVLSN